MKIFVELILGHKANIREKPTPEGYTHDWEVFVRSDQGQIQTFVEKVIFHLHESFPKSRRVIKEPPFSVKESGYAGFIINIEVIFKNKEDPKKADFAYDLFLHTTGNPISHNRKEKLIFNFPTEEFAKKLFKGGAVIHKEKESNRDRGDTGLPTNSSHIPTNSGGKSSKHANTNPAKASPKNSFQNIFGTPIKRTAPSLTTTSLTGSSNPPGPSKDPKPGKSSGKGDKSEKIFGKTEKGPSKASLEKSKASKSPMPGSSPGSEVSSNKPTSSKSSKGGGKDKKGKSDEKSKMLPPEHSAVPKKVKKSEIFEPSPSSSTSVSKSKKKSEKSKKSSKHSKKMVYDDDSNPSTPEPVVKREVELDIKEPLSPISSSSPSSSSASATSRSEENSEEDHSDGDSERTLPLNGKSNKRIAAANSTSSSRRHSRRSDSESGSDESVSSVSSSPASSSGSSSIVSPNGAKRRKTSTSSSSLTPDHTTSTTSRMQKPNSSSSVKAKKERHQKREKKSHKSRKKSKKHVKDKDKVFGDLLESSNEGSVSSDIDSYTSIPVVNGITSNSNGLSPNPAFAHTNNNSGTLTSEMNALKILYNRIASIEDPEKLQEIVEIVESCGRDSWTIETGLSFDFDLCKLSSVTIKKIQDVIFE